MTKPLPHQSIGFQFTSDLPFITLKGIGLHYIDSHHYSWNNKNRKDELCLIQYCIDGEGALEMDGIQYTIGPKDAFILNIPGNSHYYLPKRSSHWEVLFLEFSKECLPLISKIYQYTGPVLHLTDESDLANQMFSLYRSALQNELKTFFENTKAAYNLWINFTSYALTYTKKPLSKVDYAKLYIDQNFYREDLSLDLIANYAKLSKYYLCKEFHKKYGLSPGSYLKEVRIFKACRLLTTNSNYTIQDIAHMVGYSNNNYFGKVFKSAKGITPNEFRKQSNQYDFVRHIYDEPRHILGHK